MYDVAIIGGGIVGMATALHLSSLSNTSLLIIEKEPQLAGHQTGHNSGVIHSGLYYKKGSLKAQNCVEGRKALYEFCIKHDIPHERCGKLVVATREEELPALDELEHRGQANGLIGLRRLNAEQIRELEPHASGIQGLHVPETGIIDFTEVTRTYSRLVEERGGEIRLGTKATGLIKKNHTLVIETTKRTFECKYLINCAGLHSDRIAKLCGSIPGIRIVPFRGEYYELLPERQHLVRNLIYPVPDPRFPFLGVHFTRMIQGGVEAGPNAVLALKREGYNWSSFSFGDIYSYIGYAGFWRMASKYWKTGLGEVWRSLNKSAFVKALRRLIPELQDNDIHRAGAGVRAQALLPDGNLCDDFRIIETPRMIHVLNAPSPAATASLSIGRNIATLAQKNFGIS